MRYEKADHMLQLALEMQARRTGMTLVDVQETFGVGRRTAMRMRDTVMRLFPQIEEWTGDDRQKRWRLPAGTMNRLLSTTADELAALEAAVKLLEQNNRTDEASTVAAVAAKLRATLDPKTARRVEPDLDALLEAEGLAMRPGPRPRISGTIRHDLRDAIKACRQVRLHYRKRSTGETVERQVHPYGFLHGHRHYLVGWHIGAQRMALFSLANIVEVEVLDDAFQRDAAFSLEDFARRSFGVYQEEPFAVVWRFAPEAAEDAADFIFHPDQTFEPQPDGSLVVRFTAGGELEMAWHLYSWGDKVEVLEPASLAEVAHRSRVEWPGRP